MSRDARLALSFLGLHPARRSGIVDLYGSAEDALAAVAAGAVKGISGDAVLPADRCRAELEAAGCRAVLLGDEDYPTVLLDIGDPPDALFVRGTLPDGPGVGIVGTRRCTSYGRRLAAGYGRAVAEAGWVAVSGLARGIDGAAHEATVAAGGIGVAVLGSGIDVVYPSEHRTLLAGLLEAGGAVVSEYPPGTRPNGWRFPPRNRIIAGLSAVVVVVESAVTGGALVTATRAAEQGREVFATPGDVGRESSAGCNLLIRDGALPVLDPDDLVEAVSLVLGPVSPARTSDHTHASGGPVGSIPAAGVSVDEFASAVGRHGPDLLSLLGRLELDGRIRREGDTVLPGAGR
jgi:DNA processing protein